MHAQKSACRSGSDALPDKKRVITGTFERPISGSSGVLFLCLQRIEPGTPVEIEVSLIDRPFGRGSVRMMTEAHVVRAEPAAISGWHAVALSFDDITFQRDEPLPSNFERR